jgi:hypothetical protein
MSRRSLQSITVVLLCVSKSRYENRALHFEAPTRVRVLAVRPTRLPETRTSVVIHGTTQVFNRREVRPTVAVIEAARRLRRDAVVVVMQTADFRKRDNATG